MRPSAVPLALVVIACALLGWAAPATAQGLGTSRVTAVTATIYARCDPGAPAVLTITQPSLTASMVTTAPPDRTGRRWSR